uniref:Uncharacterized protein n=1 Tax=Arundo donax TaxID=35708 RepID=A0A0A8YAC3_ARUDO
MTIWTICFTESTFSDFALSLRRQA